MAYGYCRFISQHLRFLGIDGYQIGLIFVLLSVLCGTAFLASGRAHAIVSRLCPPWLYCLLLICALFVARMPTLLPGSLSPDESEFLAGAMKLRHNPVFWQSLDGTTSGPLNYYPLTLLNILGLPFDYATARLLNVICIGATIAIVYGIARLFMADWAARLTPLPPLAAAMAFRSTDFLHYSSECVSILLIAGVTWVLVVEHRDNRASWLRGAGIGAMVVFIPFAKLQAAPMAAMIAVASTAPAFFSRKEYRWQRALHIAAGLAAGIASLVLFLLAFGLFGTFQQSYIASNILYVNMGLPVSLSSFLRFCMFRDIKWYEVGILVYLLYCVLTSYHLWGRREGNREASNQFLRTVGIAALLYCSGAWWLSVTRGITWAQVFLSVLIGLAAGSIRRVIQRPTSVGELSFYDLVAFLPLAVSLFAAYLPRRAFPHYLMFLFFPLALVGVRTFARLLRTADPSAESDKDGRVTAAVPSSNPAATRSAIVFVLFTLVVPCFIRTKKLRAVFESESGMMAYQPNLECAACQLVNHFARAGDPVTVWGWAPELHVLTGTIPATRESQMSWLLIPSPARDYHRSRFLEDLQRDPPKVFVDAVAPGFFHYQNRVTDGYESFPELRQYVTSNFYLAGEVGGVRVFARKALAAR
jgi:hypothetical protein